MSTDDEFCPGCGQINDERVTERLWGIYERLDDGRQHREGLSFDGEWLREHIVDDEDHAVLMHTMERDMAQRGLCAGCGRPDLRGIDPASVLSEEDARDLADAAAERAAELRMGC
jgi:predicted Fe-S protein YdhL (DUF1289 family)